MKEPVSGEDTRPDRPWVVIVWNDPINLMSYVTYVFQKLFGYSREKATKLMLDVHHKGRAIVSSGARERMVRSDVIGTEQGAGRRGPRDVGVRRRLHEDDGAARRDFGCRHGERAQLAPAKGARQGTPADLALDELCHRPHVEETGALASTAEQQPGNARELTGPEAEHARALEPVQGQAALARRAEPRHRRRQRRFCSAAGCDRART